MGKTKTIRVTFPFPWRPKSGLWEVVDLELKASVYRGNPNEPDDPSEVELDSVEVYGGVQEGEEVTPTTEECEALAEEFKDQLVDDEGLIEEVENAAREYASESDREEI